MPSVVLQEQFAVITVPKCVVSLVLVVTTVVTPMLESGSYRNVWVVVLLAMADQDASESNNSL